MTLKYSPSVNIIRDSEKELNYIVTPNASRVASLVQSDFIKGFHSFNLIGSYGTGKSSFIWAFEQSLKAKHSYFDTPLMPKKGKVRFLNFVGSFQSIIDSFAEQLNVKNRMKGNQEIFDAIYQEYEKVGEQKGLLVIAIDELGKYLEYAAQHQPEKELYFIQQLAEFANDRDRNILFLSCLHQSFEAYSNQLNESQRKEWIKVKGRLKELTFNEPAEQLLLLASEHITAKFGAIAPKSNKRSFSKLNEEANIFAVSDAFARQIEGKIYPMELFSAYVLTLALQQYGQNERSLFTFLESTDHFGINNWEQKEHVYYNLPNVYDYLLYNFYSFISTKYNPHYNQWVGLKSALERVDTLITDKLSESGLLVKTIGLLNMFAGKGAKLDGVFLKQYGKMVLGIDKAEGILKELKQRKIIRFSTYSQSYKLYEGSDVDLDIELQQAQQKVDEITDVVGALKEHFNFPSITAKSASYRGGTPRVFKFIIGEEAQQLVPKGEIDGYINLIFDSRMTKAKLAEYSKKTNEAVLYGYYKNADKIKEALNEIERTNKVIADNQDDNVAKRELKNILDHHRILLHHFVMDDLFSEKIIWAFNGKEKKVHSKKQFNRLLSDICEEVYKESPVYLNELVNKHKVPGNIHLARKIYLEALVNHWSKPDLGFDENKFPPEKTIYLTLLKQNGIHKNTKTGYELVEPNQDSSFKATWNECEIFLEGAKQERKTISDLFDTLGRRPLKLKEGLIDFWVPTFLFIKRGDYALYGEGKFIPYINESILYLVTRNPHKYQLKTFEITDIRLKLFNKYREFLNQEKKTKLTNDSFIESIRPFLVFYKNLPDYCKKTHRLSDEAIALRKAIVNADDPEKIFFEEFPAAFKSSVEQLAKSDEALVAFAGILNNAVEEIKNSYAELINRIEGYILEEIIGERLKFADYKSIMQKRFANIREHQLLPHQKVFLQRVSSPIDDRDSWIASIAQAVLQKPLDQISDQEEQVLKDKLLHLVKELDNLRELHKSQTNDNEILKFDLTTIDGGLRSRIIEIPKGKKKDVEKLANEIRKQLKSHGSISTAVLAKLLDEELNNE